MRAVLGLAMLGGLTGCAGDVDRARARAEVVATLDRYVAAMRTLDPDAIAAFYTERATLFEPGIPPIHTRDSIRAFIAFFSGVQIDSATATADTVELYGATAFVWGGYFEQLAFPGQPASEQHGKFVIQWIQQPAGTWRIHRHYRIPVQTLVDAEPEP